MWQVDGLIHVLATASSLLSNFSKLAEDLEIFSSSEFDFVDLDDAFTALSDPHAATSATRTRCRSCAARPACSSGGCRASSR